MSFQPAFEIGDEVRLAKPDTRMAAFEEGNELILVRFDDSDNTWLAHRKGASPKEENWVAQEVLLPHEPEVSLDKQMAILLGVKHCATCTCGEAG